MSPGEQALADKLGPGWRRLWPSELWLQVIVLQDGQANWRIWNRRKTSVLAIGAEAYARPRDASRGGLRFYEVEAVALHAADLALEAGNVAVG